MASMTLPPAGALTWGDRDPLQLAAAYLAGYAPATRANYWRDLQHFAAWCAGRGIDLLDAERVHVDLWVRWATDEGYAPGTISRRLSAISGYYAYAQDEGLVARNPVDRVRRPKVPNTSPRSGLDRAEARTLLAVSEAAGPRDATVVGLLLLNGLRASEVGQLDVGALGTDRGHRVLLTPGKGGRLDVVPLAPQLQASVEAHVAGRTTGPLVLANDGGRIGRRQVARLVARLARAAGIARVVCPHDLRHAHVTHALQAGVPLHVVQDGARHADPRTTRRYDRAARSLDEHSTYRLADHLAAEVSA